MSDNKLVQADFGDRNNLLTVIANSMLPDISQYSVSVFTYCKQEPSGDLFIIVHDVVNDAYKCVWFSETKDYNVDKMFQTISRGIREALMGFSESLGKLIDAVNSIEITQ